MSTIASKLKNVGISELKDLLPNIASKTNVQKSSSVINVFPYIEFVNSFMRYIIHVYAADWYRDISTWCKLYELADPQNVTDIDFEIHGAPASDGPNTYRRCCIVPGICRRLMGTYLTK